LNKRNDDLLSELGRFIDALIADTRRLAGASTAKRLQAAGLELAEAAHIRRALAACDGNKSQAARLLQIDRRSLQRKLARRAKPARKSKR